MENLSMLLDERFLIIILIIVVFSIIKKLGDIIEVLHLHSRVNSDLSSDIQQSIIDLSDTVESSIEKIDLQIDELKSEVGDLNNDTQ